MAFARLEQRNARLASAVKVDYVNGRDGQVAKGTVTIISNTRRGSGDDRTEEATAIQWTLWGTQAENAALYLGKGSRVNVVGRMQNNNYDKEGTTVYGFQFTCEELDYLDSKADANARRDRQNGLDDLAPMASPQRAAKSVSRVRTGGSAAPGRSTSSAAAS